jgi:hypothetical protein
MCDCNDHVTAIRRRERAPSTTSQAEFPAGRRRHFRDGHHNGATDVVAEKCCMADGPARSAAAWSIGTAENAIGAEIYKPKGLVS